MPASERSQFLQDDDVFERIIAGSSEPMLLLNAAGRILKLNDRLEALFGFNRAELAGESVNKLIRRPDGSQSQLPGSRASQTGSGANVVAEELYGWCKDRAQIPIEVMLNPVATAAGTLTLTTIIDIGARRRAEAAQQQMAALVESAEDAILIKSLDGIIRSWNPGATRLLGYSAEEIIGQSVIRLIPDDRQSEELMIVEQLRKGQRVAHFETVRRRRDGSLVDVSLTISPILDRAGAVIGASKIMRDITERKRQEDVLRRSNADLEQTNKELDNFVYVASHDLRAPLTSVGTVAQWILDDDASLRQDSRERLVLIQQRVMRMQRLLKDIRDYARAGRNSKMLGPQLSAAELVAEVLATSHVPVGFAVEVHTSLRDVQVRRMPLAQVLLNLIGNAIKHHDRRGGTVSVSVQVHEAWLRFSVIDNGPGIPQEYREAVFDMFSTLKPRDAVEGSGMGLALVRRIIESLDGKCGIQTAADRGTHFWFDWPACVPDTEPA